MPQRSAEGARVAVAFDLAGERGSYAEGFADPATRRLVTPDDPVRIASISKLVVAIGAMRLVEQGRLDLDSDISRWLGWRLRNPAFPDQPLSMRLLLSHTSSLRDGDDLYVISLGGSLRAALAEPGAWDPAHGPAQGYFNYSNFNFPVVASVMEAATGERFDQLMQRLVLAPMKLDACFNWPTCSDATVARSVVLTQSGKPVRDDLGGRRPDCPVVAAADGKCDLGRWRAGENGALFSPQGGLRISARDLARIGQMLLNDGLIDGDRILSAASIALLVQPHWRFDGTNGATDRGFYCSCGYATHQLATLRDGCDDDPIGGGRRWVGHAGDAYGLRSGLWIDRTRGVGVVYFTTGLDEGPPRGRSAFAAAEEAIARRAVALLPQQP